MKKKVMIYPYNKDAYIVARFLENLNEQYELAHVVSDMEKDEGHDCGEYYLYPTLGKMIECDYTGCLVDVEEVLIVKHKRMNAEIVKERIIEALEAEKRVTCYFELADETVTLLKEKWNSDQFVYCCESNQEVKQLIDTYLVNSSNNYSLNSYEREAPVVFVGSIIEGTQEYDLMLMMTEYLRKQGYKVSTISDETYEELFQIHKYPVRKNVKEFDAASMKHQLETYVNAIDSIEKPDLMIVQLPGGFMKYDDKEIEENAIGNYIVTQAIRGDLMFVTSAYGEINNLFMDELSNICKYRFEAKLYGVNISNLFSDASELPLSHSFKLIALGKDKMDEVFEKMEKENVRDVFNVYNTSSFEAIMEKMLDELSDNSEGYSIL